MERPRRACKAILPGRLPFPGQQLDLARRVVFIHGLPVDTKLPTSVASLGPIPAQVTLPIACGKIERVGQ